MNQETHQFKPLNEIHTILNVKGIAPNKAVFAY